LRSRAARVAAALAGAAILVTAWPAATHLLMRASDLAWVAQADALGMQLASSLGAKAAQQPELVSVGVAVVPGYRNPLRDVSGLNPERIDMGVDFGGSGPVYALGNAVITNATGTSAGWLRRAAPIARSTGRTQPHPGPLRASSAELPGHRGVAETAAGANV
jgi:hypothetical protein